MVSEFPTKLERYEAWVQHCRFNVMDNSFFAEKKSLHKRIDFLQFLVVWCPHEDLQIQVEVWEEWFRERNPMVDDQYIEELIDAFIMFC